MGNDVIVVIIPRPRKQLNLLSENS